MHNSNQKYPPLAEVLALADKYSAEDWLDYELSALPLVRFQEYPDLALAALTGIVLPPHQRTILYQLHRGSGSNVVVASRGTAKSSTVCSLYATYCNIFYARRNAITLSMTGFRGGQTIFKDIERWLEGGWIDQNQDVPFFYASVNRNGRPRAVSKAATQWSLEYSSKSSNTTLPTKDPDTILGNRARDLYIDEAKLLEKYIIETIATPFLNVKGDFLHGGRLSEPNRIFFTSTVDYNFRPFQEHIDAARAGIKRDLDALAAMEAGNWKLAEELEFKGLHTYSYTQFDYTDLLIRKQVTNRKGEVFEVEYPNEHLEPYLDKRGIPFTEWDYERNRMRREGRPVEYYQTYPLDKDSLERGLRDGSSDEASWKSEQRNIVDSAMGDVYANRLVDEAACEGERCILPYRKLPDAWKVKYAEEQEDYSPPILHTCTDPCVLGVDFAPQNDFCAYVVIRLGPCAQGDFDPFLHTGKSKWSNVIWCEQWNRQSAKEVADKIRELRQRYNLVKHFEPHVLDTWQVCRGIGLDMRGGGTAVRDELCFINDQVPPVSPSGERCVRIYDPLDKDDRILAFALDPKAEPLLDTIWPTDDLNSRLVMHTIAEMEQGFLYLPKYLEQSQRPGGKAETSIAYEASLALQKQLRKLRQEPTKNHRRFYMDGDTKLVQNKKDLWAAFIYAAKQMRAHVIRQRQIDDTPPPMGGVVTKISSRRGYNGRAAGARS